MKKINEYLKVSAAAKFLGIAQNTLRNWEKMGKIAVHRNPFNRYRMYKVEELENILSMINHGE